MSDSLAAHGSVINEMAFYGDDSLIRIRKHFEPITLPFGARL